MAQKGIQCGIHYPLPLHRQEAYARLGYEEGDFPHVEAIAKRIISLPLFPEMSGEQIDHVCECLIGLLR
jgi:dTDP-4-amino-4,6-dideoxygalactose transaminase